MTSSTTDTRQVALRPELFSSQEELAIAGFLAGYGGLTREAYMLDLRPYVTSVSEATGADIEALGLERGHRTLTILRKGGKTVRSTRATDGSSHRSRGR
jgi:hypothetical protein